MTSVTEKIQKRRFYPVTIGDETFHVAALSVADRRRMDGIDGVIEKSFYGIGRAMRDADGMECFPKEGDETDTAYAQRIESLFPEIPTDTFNEQSESINKLGIVPRAKVLEKN
jgi:hypothetical protein